MNKETCKCGKPYSECKYPVSHSHPSTFSIKLPTAVNAALRGAVAKDYKKLPSASRSVLNDFEL